MPWTHNYSALGSIGLTALAVALPILFLFWALAIKRMKGHVAGILTLLPPPTQARHKVAGSILSGPGD